MTINLAGKPGSYRPPAAARYRPLGPQRTATAQSMRKLAGKIQVDHQGMGTHQHLRDAARALEDGNHDGAIRHLSAAIGNMTPQSLHRHGVTGDEGHATAKANMDAIHRHLLLVKDIIDTHARNQALISRIATENALTGPPGQRPVNGSDPGALAQKPEPRAGQSTQRAMNAPQTTNSGGPDPAAARPRAITAEQKTRQVAASNSGDLTTVIELAFNSHQPRRPDGRWVRADDLGPELLAAAVARHFPGQEAADAAGIRPTSSSLAGRPPVVYSRRGVQAAVADAPDVAEFSAQTGRLAVTPAPRGRPGGPGLYDVKGNEHSPYFQQVVKALIQKRGMPPGKAYAIAWGALRKWQAGGGNVHPEVRAAAAGALAQENTARARAHSHANNQLRARILDLSRAARDARP